MTFLYTVPQIDDVVFMVSSVEIDVIGIHQLEGKQDQQDLNGVFPSIHKVSIEDVRRLFGWQAVLQGDT